MVQNGSLERYTREILIQYQTGRRHTLATRSSRAKFNYIPETIRLHDYDATGNIQDSGEIVHALLRSVAEALATM